VKLYTYWRSLATLRVRIAMNLKGMSADPVIVDLAAGHQRKPEFQAVNPQMVVPALVLDDGGPILFQSMAILEYLEETHPTPPLLPKDPRGRARVRGISQISVADTHPLVVPRVREYILKDLKLDEATLATWIKHWTTAGMRAIEENLAGNPATGVYCHGDSVTLADVCTVSQAIGYQLFGNDLGQFPTVKRIFDTCMQQQAFANAHPLKQPDAPNK
jgi:maleylacetoacetate isomerase